MRKILLGGVAACGLAALTLPAQAGTLYLANITGAGENPPTPSTATGLGIVILNDAGTVATVSASHNVPLATLIAGHIHRGAAGTNGPVIFPFPNPASGFAATPGPGQGFTLTWNIPAADVINLKNGALYFNFHTVAFPGGVIRGQALPALLAPSARNGTQAAVAAALDVSAGFSSDLDIALVLANLGNATQKAQALDDFSGRSLYILGREGVESMATLGRGVFAHSENARRGSGEGIRKVGNWSVFAGVGSDFGMRDPSAEEVGARFTRPFVLGGVDYALSETARAGLAIGYASGKNTLKFGGGQTKGETKALQAFASTTLGESHFAIDALAGYGWTDFTTSRTLGSIGRAAAGGTKGTTWSLGVKASAPIATSGPVQVVPYAMLDYRSTDIDAYAETGAGGAGLVVPGHRVKNATGEIGASLDIPSTQSWGTLSGRLQVGYAYLLERGAGTLTTGLVGTPVTFPTVLTGPGRSAARLGAALVAATAEGMTASIGYQGSVGATRLTSHAIEAHLGFAF
jgi:uncharacterized protein YhjY with autotransporter beta-barrel domain